MDDNSFYACPERAAACRPWGGGIVWRPPSQLVTQGANYVL